MMNYIFNIVSIILTGIVSFTIAKYQNDKNKPVDKLEIAYNRVYFPLYQQCYHVHIEKKEINYDVFINETKKRLLKYEKYIDIVTYKKFNDHIYKVNSKLRNSIGYLHPNFYQMYYAASLNDQFIFRIIIYYFAVYFLSIFKGLMVKYSNITAVLNFIIAIVIIWTVIDFSQWGIKYLYYKKSNK